MCNAEGGDVIIHNDYVFVGVSSDETFQKFKTARTNYAGMDYLADEFPAKEFKGFELHKDDLDPRKGALHLDCAFQPLGCGALLAPHLFKNESDVKWLMKYFGEENIYICSEEDAYNLCTNVFSISENEVIISGLCSSLKDWLEARQMIVHTVAYDAIVKMGGLLRCSTMPLSRES
jgi:N-dimethylarginine dimethylaminohydrolase